MGQPMFWMNVKIPKDLDEDNVVITAKEKKKGYMTILVPEDEISSGNTC